MTKMFMVYFARFSRVWGARPHRNVMQPSKGEPMVPAAEIHNDRIGLPRGYLELSMPFGQRESS